MAKTDLIVPMTEKDIGEALANPDKLKAMIAKIDKAASKKFDMSTKAGRDECRSTAYSVTRSKTAVENVGKALTEDLRAKLSAMTAVRKDAVEQIAAIAEKTRAPLDEWEEQEKVRQAAIMAAIDELKMEGVTDQDEAGMIGQAISTLKLREIDEATFEEFTAQAEAVKEAAIERLEQAKKTADLREENERMQAEIAAAKAKLAEEEAKREKEREAERERIRAEERAALQKEREEHEAEQKRQAEELAAARKAQADAEAKVKEAEEREATRKAEAEAKARAAEEQKKAKPGPAVHDEPMPHEAEEVDEAEFGVDVDAAAGLISTAMKVECLLHVKSLDVLSRGRAAVLDAILADYEKTAK